MPPPPSNTHTVAEARELRCHAVQLHCANASGTVTAIISSLGYSVNRDGLRAIEAHVDHELPHPLVRCIADKCMAWQWDNATEGFCGLARD